MATGQMSFDLYPNHEHKSCKGCVHLEWIYTYREDPKTHVLKEHVEYGCDLGPWGYQPIGNPKRARGCPPNVPERYETNYLKAYRRKEVHY